MRGASPLEPPPIVYQHPYEHSKHAARQNEGPLLAGAPAAGLLPGAGPPPAGRGCCGAFEKVADGGVEGLAATRSRRAPHAPRSEDRAAPWLAPGRHRMRRSCAEQPACSGAAPWPPPPPTAADGSGRLPGAQAHVLPPSPSLLQLCGPELKVLESVPDVKEISKLIVGERRGGGPAGALARASVWRRSGHSWCTPIQCSAGRRRQHPGKKRQPRRVPAARAAARHPPADPPPCRAVPLRRAACRPGGAAQRRARQHHRLPAQRRRRGFFPQGPAHPGAWARVGRPH